MKKKIFSLFILMTLISGGFAEELVTVGMGEGDGALFVPGKVAEGPEGNIYVSDRSDYFIKVYSPEGKYIRRIGGQGEGPGEMKAMSSWGFGFTPDGKRLYFVEWYQGHRWITFMKLSGQFDRVLKLNLQGHFGVSRASFLADHSLVVGASFSEDINRRGDYFEYFSSDRLLRLDPSGDIRKVIIRRERVQGISLINDGGTVTLPFQPLFRWLIFRDKVIFSDGLSLRLKVFDLEGRQVGEIETGLPEATAVTDKDLETWREESKERFLLRDRGWYMNFGRVIEKYKKSLYQVKPNLSEMSLTPGGHLLLAGPGQPESGNKTYRLVALPAGGTGKGRTLLKTDLPGYNLTVTPGFLFIKMADEEESVTVRCLRRRGDEKQDILRLKKIAGKTL